MNHKIICDEEVSGIRYQVLGVITCDGKQHTILVLLSSKTDLKPNIFSETKYFDGA